MMSKRIHRYFIYTGYKSLAMRLERETLSKTEAITTAAGLRLSGRSNIAVIRYTNNANRKELLHIGATCNVKAATI
jgi:hypothetical protein